MIDFGFEISDRSLIIGGVTEANFTEDQRSMLYSMTQNQRAFGFNLSDIPQEGGNWTHYFVCSDGEKIDYAFPKPDFFTCETTDEILIGEQYNTSWIAFRHKEIIRTIALESAVLYYLTNNSSDG